MTPDIFNINIEHLCVLKIDNDNRFYIDYEKIDNSLLLEVNYNEVQMRIKNYDKYNQKLLIEELIFVRKFFNELYITHRELFRGYSYCDRTALSSSYINFQGLVDINPLLIMFNYGSAPTIQVNNETRNLSQYLNEFFSAYFIEKAYVKCLKNPIIKVFSHRKVGWHNYNFILNEELDVDIKTNFSYGYSSYFLLTLKYRNIKIIPFSRLVIYRYAKTSELIRNTIEFEVTDESWFYAINFIKESCNTLIDKKSNNFIKKYFVDECDKLCRILPQYLDKEVFQLSDNLYGSFSTQNEVLSKVELHDEDLIIFRAEKVLGAMNFVKSIKELNTLFTVEEYIRIIETCRVKTLPMVEKCLKSCKRKINIEQIRFISLNDKLLPINELFNEFVLKLENYNKLICEYKESLFSDNLNESEFSKATIDDLVKVFIEQNIQDYHNVLDTYSSLETQIKQLESMRNETTNKIQRLETYLSKLNEFLLELNVDVLSQV